MLTSIRRYHHGDLQNIVVKIALTHIAKKGAQSLSLREVVRAAGVSHASVYRHAEQGFRKLTLDLQKAAQRPGDSSLKLRATGAAYVGTVQGAKRARGGVRRLGTRARACVVNSLRPPSTGRLVTRSWPICRFCSYCFAIGPCGPVEF
jgi:hypothetical protein